MTLFDAYLFVDWSAENQPTGDTERTDAIWVGECVRGKQQKEQYHPTRSRCLKALRLRLHQLSKRGLRVLVGFDFPYGYPSGFAAALSLGGGAARWEKIWSHLSSLIEDDTENASNRWCVASTLNKALMKGARPVGPFWGCPGAVATPTLKPGKHKWGLKSKYQTRSGRWLREWRHAELYEKKEKRRKHARSTVQPVWKLHTPGSVGSQALLGIPRVAHLRYDHVLAPFSKVWPFETGFGPEPSPSNGPFVLHAEIWPVLFQNDANALLATDPELKIRDRAQVRAMCAWADRTDTAGQLGAFFDRPKRLSASKVKDCVEEEGWILGLP
jgi:hypothetical protein